MGDRRFNRSLLGISPQKVSSYLRQLKNLQDKERSELEANVQAQLAEQKLLQAERVELSARQNAQADQLDCQDLVMKRAQVAVRVLQQYTQQEIAGLQGQVEQKRREQQQKIERMEQQTDTYNQALQALIAELGATMQKFSSSSLDLLDVIEPIERPPVVPAGTLPQQDLIKSENVIQFKIKALTEQAAKLRNGTNQWSETDDDVVPQREASAGVPSVFVSPVRLEPSVAPADPNSFWGNIQQFVSNEHSVHEVMQDLQASLEQPRPTPTVETREQAETRTQSETADHVYETAASKESEAVSTEIASIRNRYILGKVAGEDLLDNHSRLIVTKGEVISAEVVEIAEREGKLPDLIVNMKIPGVSIDKP